MTEEIEKLRTEVEFWRVRYLNEVMLWSFEATNSPDDEARLQELTDLHEEYNRQARLFIGQPDPNQASTD